MTGKVYTTTFGIDVTKKCYNGSDTANRKYWLYGSLSDDCLKNISLSYEEHFGLPYAEQVRDEYEKLTSAAVATLKKFVKVCQGLANGENIGNAISESGSGSGGNKENLTGVILDLGVAVASAQEAMGGNGTGIDNLTTAITKSVKVPAANIPTRSAVPGLTLGYGNSIKINFRYGNAGIFNAQTEVYEPIKNIMEGFKTFSVTGSKVSAVDTGIPWEVGGYTAKADALTKFIGGPSIRLSELTNGVKKVSTSVLKFSKAAGKILTKKAALEKFYEEMEADPMSYVKDSSENVEKADHDFHFLGIGQEYKVKDDVLKTMISNEADIDKLLSGEQETTHVDTLDNKLSAWNKVSHDNKVNGLINAVKDNKEAATDSVENIWTDIGKLASIEAEDVCSIIEERANKVTEMQICLGCYDTNGNNIYYNIDDIDTNIKNNTIRHALEVSGIPEKVEAGFDYTDLDANGYPKSGWIAIKKLWIVKPYNSFSGTFKR